MSQNNNLRFAWLLRVARNENLAFTSVVQNLHTWVSVRLNVAIDRSLCSIILMAVGLECCVQNQLLAALSSFLFTSLSKSNVLQNDLNGNKMPVGLLLLVL